MSWWTRSPWRDSAVRQVVALYEINLKAGIEPKEALEKAMEFVLELQRIEYGDASS